MELVPYEANVEDTLSWCQTAVACSWAVIATCILWKCCYSITKFEARWTTSRRQEVAPIVYYANKGVQTLEASESSCPAEGTFRPSVSSSLETPRRRSSTPRPLQGDTSALRENKSVILRDMAKRAQPILAEMEVRRLGWENAQHQNEASSGSKKSAKRE